jgi:hypothetical protein
MALDSETVITTVLYAFKFVNVSTIPHTIKIRSFVEILIEVGSVAIVIKVFESCLLLTDKGLI